MKSACACDICCDAASTIQAKEELTGLFIGIQLIKHFFLYNVQHFHSDLFNLIESNRFLPKGNLTVREDGHIVGQVHLNDLSQWCQDLSLNSEQLFQYEILLEY
jgi:hypothetical protein